MTIFFTANTHFGHANIIKYCARPFENAEEMDEEMILRWNNHVKVGDTVYHLGNFCWGEPSHYVHRLNGKITFLRGPHDKNMDAYALRDRLLTIQPLQDEFGNPRSIILCHYAMRSWPNSHYASWHLYGHHHGKLPPYGLSFDVGVDCWDFAPVSLGQVEEKMKTLKPIVDYRKEG